MINYYKKGEFMKKRILLLHGWDYKNYYCQNNKSAWNNREEFIKVLSRQYEIAFFDMPGFGKNKPSEKKAYTLEDYADYVKKYLDESKESFDYILGYSFGGAVAIILKTKYQLKEKLILVSPAIKRETKKSKSFIKTPELLKPIREWARDLYLTKCLKTPEMVYANKWLKKTYQNIVRHDLTEQLIKINHQDCCIVFGKEDNQVQTYALKKSVPKAHQKKIYIIDGGHDIGNTNAGQIVKIINNEFENNKSEL